MITNTGKSIIAKYLVGQAPAYASYIALGCGASPLESDGILGDYSSKTSMDFEMFRVPITSRGFVNESGVNKIVLTAELPTEERYEITEVGIYSAGSNPSVGAYDSKTVYIFNDSEGWEYHSQESTATTIPAIYVPIGGEDGFITGEYPINPTTREYDANGTLTALPVFKTTADNKTFTGPERQSRYERCRFLNSVIMIQGNNANLSVEEIGGIRRLKVENGSNHIHLTGANLDFNKNAPSDELKLAFSVVSKSPLEQASAPERVRILFEFASSDIHGSGQWARFDVDIDDINLDGNNLSSIKHDFTNNRYVVSSKQLQDLHKSSGFTWAEVDVAKIYVSVIKNSAMVTNKAATASVVTLTTSEAHDFSVGDSIIVNGLGSSGRFDGAFTITETTSTTIKYASAGAVVASTTISPTVRIESPSEDYYVALDAFRLDNNSQANPLYGLTGYSVIRNTGSKPIVKEANTTNYIEFRFGMDVV